MARLTGVLHHNDHSDTSRLIDIVDVVDGILGSSPSGFDDGGTVAVCGQVDVAGGVDTGI